MWMYANSMDIYDKIENYSLLHNQRIPKVDVPQLIYNQRIDGAKYPTLYHMHTQPKDKYEHYWVAYCMGTLSKKGLHKDERYLERLEEEARVKKIIGEKLGTNMFAYPITLQHYIDMFWDLGSTVGAGRGSSCSGLNHYLLGVTQLDPIKWELPFWRLEL